MNKKLTKNIERLSGAFPTVMHFFHNIAGQVSKVGEYSLAQYRVLMLLYHRGKLTVTDLHNELHTAQSTASGMIDRLVQQELVIREKDNRDKRKCYLNLSKKARNDLDKRMHSMNEVYEKILQDFSLAEQDQLIKALENVAQILGRKAVNN